MTQLKIEFEEKIRGLMPAELKEVRYLSSDFNTRLVIIITSDEKLVIFLIYLTYFLLI